MSGDAGETEDRIEHPRGQRVDLGAPLEGFYVRIDVEQLDCGLLEDLESNKVRDVLDAISRIVVGGHLPHGTDRKALRKLTPVQLAPIIKAIPELFDIPKPG